MKLQSSHYVYIILNSDGTIYCDKHGDYRIYKTKEGLQSQIEKYQDKKIAVFHLTEVMKIHDFLK